jgi:hypothetical protein
MAQPISAYAKLLAGREKARERTAQQRAATAPPAPEAKRAEAAPDSLFSHLLQGARRRASALPSASETQARAGAMPKPGTADFLVAAGKKRRGEAL